MPSLSVVIVTRDRREELAALLSDLSRLRFSPEDEVVIVDNGSRDGTSEVVRERLPAARLIAWSENRGAPAARNAAADTARGDWLIFLDDDTRIEDSDFLSRFQGALASAQDASALAFLLLDPESGLPRSFEIPRRNKREASSPCETSYFVSAGCAVKRSDFRGLGGMDPSLFYGFEELDFCYRAVSHGLRIYYRPEVRVIHALSRSGRPSWRRTYYFYRNKIWISARYLPWRMFFSQLAVWSAYFLKESLRIGRPDVFLAALTAGVAGLPRRMRSRRRDRIPREVLLRLRGIEGRLYY